jgi:hypothetical protein
LSKLENQVDFLATEKRTDAGVVVSFQSVLPILNGECTIGVDVCADVYDRRSQQGFLRQLYSSSPHSIPPFVDYVTTETSLRSSRLHAHLIDSSLSVRFFRMTRKFGGIPCTKDEDEVQTEQYQEAASLEVGRDFSLLRLARHPETKFAFPHSLQRISVTEVSSQKKTFSVSGFEEHLQVVYHSAREVGGLSLASEKQATVVNTAAYNQFVFFKQAYERCKASGVFHLSRSNGLSMTISSQID